MPPRGRNQGPTMVPPITSRRMKAVRRDGTAPELLVRNRLREKGFRFSTNDRALPGSPDLAFQNNRVAVFVHGCFWHGHHDCRRARLPKTNEQFWRAKVASNQKRDREKERSLRRKGWRVLILWQCRIEADAEAQVRRITTLLQRTDHAS